MSRFRRRYGASPLHALAHLAAFALAGFALLQLLDVRAAWNVFAWLLAAVVLHDFVLLPFYSALDRAAQAASGDAVNYLRVPVALSALLLLVFFPLILGCSTGKLEQVSGAPAADYLARWLLITGVLCAGSAVLYGRRVAQGGGEAPARCGRRDGPRVGERVDVAQGREVVRREPERDQALALDRAGVGLAHRHAVEDARVRPLEPDRPVAAVIGGAEHGIGAVRERGQAGVEQLGRDLGRVHADQQRRAADVLECRRKPLCETAAALRDELEPVGQPAVGLAVERHHPTGGQPRASDGGQRVLERRAREHGCLLRVQGRGQAGLHAAGHRRLGHHDERGAHASAAVMSRTVRSVPRTVPVTFERPRRGRYVTATSSIVQPAAAARTTISSGQPNRRSSRPRPSSASRRAARIGPEIAQRDAGAPPQLRRQRPVRQPRVQRPRPGLRVAGAEHRAAPRRPRPARPPAEARAGRRRRRSP